MAKEKEIQKWMDLADKASQLWPEVAEVIINLAQHRIKKLNGAN